MEPNSKRKQLGKGLSALFGDQASDYKELDKVQSIRFINIQHLHKGQFQPRKHFAEIELNELKESILSKGVLQPILVRRNPAQNNQYEIIAGERRWRAALEAGLKEIPVIIKDFKDAEVLEVGLIENLIRQNLNPLEEAEGYERLLKEFSYSQEQLAETLHKSRSHIANTLRLLQLPEDIKEKLRNGEISSGHARALLRFDDPQKALDAVIDQKLSVRDVEKMAQEQTQEKSAIPLRKNQNKVQLTINPDVIVLEESLKRALGLNVKILSNGSQGSVTLNYNNLLELDDIITRLTKNYKTH
jgi:ParB family transcriptional regulator, chromosome partitioning protein